MKTLLVDSSLCIKCCNCQIACKDEHCGNDWSPIAVEQGDGQFWIRVDEWETGSGDKVKVNRLPVMCQHCANPSCAKALPDAVYRREDGVVILDSEKTHGHPEVVDSCPYGTIYWNDSLQVAQKCTMCAHLLDEGWEEPRCVTACPTSALQFVDVADLISGKIKSPLEKLHPEYGTKPFVAYQKLPAPFIVGSLVDGTIDSSIRGAKVSAYHQVTGKVYEVETDAFGDFEINVEDSGYYTVSVKVDGFYAKKITDIKVEDGTNLGNVYLYAA